MCALLLTLVSHSQTSGDSLCYAFIGFDNDKSSEDAYFKMNNVLIDDRRIKARASPLPPSILFVCMDMQSTAC